MSKSKKKYILYISILVIVTAMAVYFVLKQDPKAVLAAMQGCNPWWLVGAVGVLLLSYCVEGLILTLLVRMYNRKYHWYKGFLNAMIGVFFSGITPSNSGGQFAQAFTFSKQGVKVTNAASVLFMHFIIYQCVSVLFGGAVLIFKFDEMRSLTEVIEIFGFKFDIITLSLVGFGINALVIVGLFFLAFSSRVHNILVKYGIGFLAKIHIVKNKDEQILKLNTKVETFRIELKRLTQNWPVLIGTAFLFLLKLSLINSVPFFIAKGMGLEFTSSNTLMNIIDSTSMTTLVSTITGMVPIPGASGGAELVFRYMFGGTFFPNASGNEISALILLWRSITFYFGLIVGFIIFVSYHESPKDDQSLLKGDSRTLLEIDVINLNNSKKKKEAEDKNLVHVEPQLLTVDDVEAHFASLKMDLQDQLRENEDSLEKESEKKKSRKKKKDKKEGK